MEFGSVAVPPTVEIEREVVERARRGDQQALAHIYNCYVARVYRYVLARVGSVVEAEDLTEDVFLRMLGAISGYRIGEIPFSAWLFRIAHNHVVSYFRKNSVRGTPEALDDTMPDSRSDPASTVETRMMLEEVMNAARGLSDAQREVIALRFAVGLSVAETAQVLGKREGNIKALQHKALARLQHVLLTKPESMQAEA